MPTSGGWERKHPRGACGRRSAPVAAACSRLSLAGVVRAEHAACLSLHAHLALDCPPPSTHAPAQAHKKDYSSRRGLLAVLSQRKQLMLYLQVRPALQRGCVGVCTT